VANYALGFIPGYNAAKLAFTVAGGNVNFFQNALSGKSIVTFSNPYSPSANPLQGLNGLTSAYNAIMQTAKQGLTSTDIIADVEKAAGTAGTVANFVNTAAAAVDLYGCRIAK